MPDSKRFRALSQDGVIHLHGILDDASNLYGLTEALNSHSNSLDFGALESASWNGLIRLNHLLASQSTRPFHLKNLPAPIFNILRMTSEFRDLYKLESFDLWLFDEISGSVFTEHFTRGDTRLNTLLNNEAKDIQVRLLGVKRHFPSLLESDGLEEPFHSPTLRRLLIDYGFYSSVIFSLVRDTAINVTATVSDKAKLLENQISSILKINKLFARAGLPEDLANKVPFELELIQVQASEIKGKILFCIDAVEKGLRELAIECLSQGKQHPRTATAIYQDFVKVTLSSHKVQDLAEDLGTTVGSILNVLDIVGAKSILSDYIRSGSLSNEDKELIIDSLSIMDPMADEDDTLASHVDEFFELIEKEAFQASSLAQSCDLMRQIVEHRLNETKIISEYISIFAPESLDEEHETLELDVIAKIEAKMVTDQEKLARKHFLHERPGTVEKTSATPGEVLLF